MMKLLNLLPHFIFSSFKQGNSVMSLFKLTLNAMLFCFLVLHLTPKSFKQNLLLFGFPGSLSFTLFEKIIGLFELLFILMSLFSKFFIKLGLSILQDTLIMLP